MEWQKRFFTSKLTVSNWWTKFKKKSTSTSEISSQFNCAYFKLKLHGLKSEFNGVLIRLYFLNCRMDICYHLLLTNDTT